MKYLSYPVLACLPALYPFWLETLLELPFFLSEPLSVFPLMVSGWVSYGVCK